MVVSLCRGQGNFGGGRGSAPWLQSPARDFGGPQMQQGGAMGMGPPQPLMQQGMGPQQGPGPQLGGLVAELQNQVAYQQQMLKQQEVIKSVSSLCKCRNSNFKMVSKCYCTSGAVHVRVCSFLIAIGSSFCWCMAFSNP